MKRIRNRTRARLADIVTLARCEQLHVTLDVVKLSDVLQRRLRDLALVCRMQIEELASRVRHTAKLDHTLCKQRLVARVVVAQQLALPLPEERSRVLTRARFSEVVDHGFQRFEGTRRVRPQIRALRLAFAGDEHRHRRFVSLQNVM